jgi:GntR family transcriptional regulator
MELARNEGSSLHHQISAVLRARILSGRYPKDAIIPAETALMDSFAVSRATVRRALLTLESEGLIERRQGKGTRVLHQPVKNLHEPFEQHINRIERDAQGTTVKILAFGFEEVPANVQPLLELGDRDRVLRIVSVRLMEDWPLRYMVGHIPAALGETLHREQFAQATFIHVLEEMGQQIRRLEDEVSATLADPEVAVALDVRIGAPLLEVSRILLDGDRRPIAHLSTFFPPDRGKLRTAIDSGEW